MKRFTGWLIAGAVAAIGCGVMWTLVSNRFSCCLKTELIESWQGDVVEPVPSPSLPPSPPISNVVETVLLLPEIEVAPLPEPVAASPKSSEQIAESSTTLKSVRPEATRGDRPWMPYAPEDRELSDTRRLAWAKLIVQDAQAVNRDDLEETQEPPVIEGAPKKAGD